MAFPIICAISLQVSIFDDVNLLFHCNIQCDYTVNVCQYQRLTLVMYPPSTRGCHLQLMPELITRSNSVGQNSTNQPRFWLNIFAVRKAGTRDYSK